MRPEVNYLLGAIASMSYEIEMGRHVSYPSIRVSNALGGLAKFYGLTLEECDNHAWNQIKDRKGKTVDGEFIKEQA